MGNVTGILVDKDIYTIEQFKIIREDYIEEADGRSCTFILPYVTLQDKLSGYKFVLIATHTNGTSNQFPVSGLRKLLSAVRGI